LNASESQLRVSKIFGAPEIVKQDTFNLNEHSAPLVDFLWGPMDHFSLGKKLNHTFTIVLISIPRGINNARCSALVEIHFALLVDFALPDS
jgi:hypothetical protein